MSEQALCPIEARCSKRRAIERPLKSTKIIVRAMPNGKGFVGSQEKRKGDPGYPKSPLRDGGAGHEY